MIKKGKKAEIIHCKQGKTLAPIAGSVKSPLPGKVYNGEEHLQTVQIAKVMTANPQYSEKSAVLQETSLEKPKSGKVYFARTIGTVTYLEQRIVPQNLNCKSINCRNVQNDITLKKLFHIEKG